MITPLGITVDSNTIDNAVLSLPGIDFKLTINEPSGDFFYDPWHIKQEFKNTVWEEILTTLPAEVGEARLIKLSKKECYMAHADIDNRWHLPLILGVSYLIDLDNDVMHTLARGHWYHMDAGRIHSAVNFGGEDRIQLVVRQLLKRSPLQHPKRVTILPDDAPNARYMFDNQYSTLLNRINRDGFMDNFKIEGDSVTFDVESQITIPEYKGFTISTVNLF